MNDAPTPNEPDLRKGEAESVPERSTLGGGKYRVLGTLGRGAMGVVYEAEQQALRRRVAIKLLHPQVTERPQARERFRREALAASRIEHRNSTRIFDFGEEQDGTCFIVMELLQGRSLGTIAEEEGPMPLAQAVDLLGQALSALAVAHDAGIVHRDLKPDNIVIVDGVDDHGEPCDVAKVCDFGIAKLFGAESGETLTQDGTVSGTPHYMSPEQCQGKDLDARSDLYACGVMLYRLLAGTVPFTGDNAFAVVYRQVTEQHAPVRSHRPELPEAVDDFLRIAMAKSPADRFQSARQMRTALRALLQAPEVASAALAAARPGGRTDGPAASRVSAAVTESELAVLPARRSWVWPAVAVVAIVALAVVWSRGKDAATEPAAGGVDSVASGPAVAAAQVEADEQQAASTTSAAARDDAPPPTPTPTPPAPTLPPKEPSAPAADAAGAAPEGAGQPADAVPTPDADAGSTEAAEAPPVDPSPVPVVPTPGVPDHGPAAPESARRVAEAARKTPPTRAAAVQQAAAEAAREKGADAGATAPPSAPSERTPPSAPPLPTDAPPPPKAPMPGDVPPGAEPPPLPPAVAPPGKGEVPPGARKIERFFNPDPMIRLVDVTLLGGISKLGVQQALSGLPAIGKSCWNLAAKKENWTEFVRLELDFVIDEDGRFRDVSGGGGPKGLGPCVAGKVALLRSRTRPDTGTVRGAASLEFAP